MQLLFSLPELIIILVVLVIIMVLCVKTGKLTLPAALTAGLTGLLVALGAGYEGMVLLGTFFILGVKATSHKKEWKAKTDPQGLHPEKRKAGQVFANGGVAAIMSVLALLDPSHKEMYVMMLAASLASATADTLSSELGMVYGRNFYNIITFKREAKGLDGVVSLEGTLLGAAGALILAVLYALFSGFGSAAFFVLIAGIIGNLVDSLLGATLERKHYIGNDVVNFLNTLLAAFIAMMFYWL